MPPAAWRPLLAVTAATGVWAGLGAALGGLLRHQVAATVTALVWVLFVENLGAAMLGQVGQWLPGRAVLALVGGSPADELLPAALAAPVLACYVVLGALAAGVCTTKRDV
jgi:hypothetical protein